MSTRVIYESNQLTVPDKGKESKKKSSHSDRYNLTFKSKASLRLKAMAILIANFI